MEAYETYEKKLLVAMAEKYRKSKKEQGTNVITRRTRLTPDKLYPAYRQNDGDLDQIEAVNQAIYRCRTLGFVTVEQEGFSNEIRTIYLVDEKIDQVERYLEETYHYAPRHAKRRQMEALIATYRDSSAAAGYACAQLQQMLEKNQIPQNYTQWQDILKTLAFVENNRRDLFLREASMLLFGDSKYLEDTVLHPVCRILRAYANRPCLEGELEDEILEDYHIVRERQKLCLKGNLTLCVAGKELELGTLTGGVEFFADTLAHLEWVRVRTPRFMTVENWTAWQRLQDPDTTLFYLGGYCVRAQRDFLKQVYLHNPQLRFWHFGDIDAGGFYIHEHLCRVTGIPFGLYRMSRQELDNPRFQACLRPLTQQDRVRLASLEKQAPYRDTVRYMLAQNVKLEQEIVSLDSAETETTEAYFV